MENFEAQHLTEKRLQYILLTFSLLSIFIACLGLFGLSVFSLEQRMKEIGIRKAMGAQTAQVIRLISSDFSRLIIIANLIAIPFAYFILREWLHNFPYKMGLELWVFILATSLAWLLALITIFIQTWKAGKLNPAEVLKYE